MEKAMFRIAIAVLSILLIGAGFAFLADYPAEIVLSLPHWRITLTPAAALAIFLAGFFVLWLAVLVLKIVTAPFFWPSILRRHKRAQACQALSAGLLAAFTGDTAQAQALAKEAQSALPADKEPLTALLLAQIEDLRQAQKPFFTCAEHMRQSLNPQKQEQAAERPNKSSAEYLAMLRAGSQAGAGGKGGSAMRLPALTALYRRRQAAGDNARAASLAAAAALENPALIWASMAAIADEIEAGAWDKALELYENFAKAWQKAAKRDKSGHLQGALDYYRQVLYCGQARALFPYHPHQARQIALAAVKICPAFVPAITLAAQILFHLHEWRKGEKLLQTQWRQAPHPDLGRVYIKAGGLIDSPAKRLERAQNLAALTPDNAVAHRLVAKAAFAANDDILAREQLDKAMAQEPDRQGFILLARLAQKHNETEQSQQFLAKALTAPLEKAWCADGQKLAHWQALAPISRRLGACQWQSPMPVSIVAAADLQFFLQPQPEQPAATAADTAGKTPGNKNKQSLPDIEKAARGVARIEPAKQTGRKQAAKTKNPAYINVDNPGVADKEE
ncbi:MAG: hypothetical protein DU429_07040 [Candidatus Tokpelaia sp.]|nr:MAG: hypothetical protein DU429_07040 [Candidatus Tokpelaia sp.]KAA6206166.1 MAG: hypothetical protein DU430_02085 [Candidatus Tokpelaia sp.]